MELKYRDLILKQTKELVQSDPNKKISIQEICSRATISVGSFYNIFRNKEDLFNELIRNELDRLKPIIEQGFSTAPESILNFANFLNEALFWPIYIKNATIIGAVLRNGPDNKQYEIVHDFCIHIVALISTVLQEKYHVEKINAQKKAYLIVFSANGLVETLSHYEYSLSSIDNLKIEFHKFIALVINTNFDF